MDAALSIIVYLILLVIQIPILWFLFGKWYSFLDQLTDDLSTRFSNKVWVVILELLFYVMCISLIGYGFYLRFDFSNVHFFISFLIFANLILLISLTLGKVKAKINVQGLLDKIILWYLNKSNQNLFFQRILQYINAAFLVIFINSIFMAVSFNGASILFKYNFEWPTYFTLFLIMPISLAISIYVNFRNNEDNINLKRTITYMIILMATIWLSYKQFVTWGSTNNDIALLFFLISISIFTALERVLKAIFDDYYKQIPKSIDSMSCESNNQTALNTETRNKNSVNAGIRFIIFVAGCSVLIAAGLWWGVKVLNPEFDVEKLGTVGDWIGGTSAPFLNFASFLILLAAFFSQREELNETRKEFKEQNKTLAVQRFENTFFQLITLHNQIVSSVELEGDLGRGTGRAAFQTALENFHKYFVLNQEISEDEIERIRNVYNHFFKDYQDKLGHYFRNLYRIYLFIDKSESDIFSKKLLNDYSDLIRAQLSSYEIIMLMYNGMSEHGKSFLPLMKKYDLLDGIDKTLLVNESHKDLYDQMLKEV